MKEDLLNKNYQILEHHGVYKQITIWIEEMSELTKELCKWQRHYEKLEGDLTPTMLFNLENEVIDTQICLDQIKKAINYSLKSQEKIYEYKVNRELNRIKNGE